MKNLKKTTMFLWLFLCSFQVSGMDVSLRPSENTIKKYLDQVSKTDFIAAREFSFRLYDQMQANLEANTGEKAPCNGFFRKVGQLLWDEDGPMSYREFRKLMREVILAEGLTELDLNYSLEQSARESKVAQKKTSKSGKPPSDELIERYLIANQFALFADIAVAEVPTDAKNEAISALKTTAIEEIRKRFDSKSLSVELMYTESKLGKEHLASKLKSIKAIAKLAPALKEREMAFFRNLKLKPEDVCQIPLK